MNFQASAALSRYTRVRLDSNGEVALCAAASEDGIGTLVNDALAADDQVAVRLVTKEGTHVMLASGAVTKGNVVYADASGKVTATPGTVKVGVANEAATDDGDVIEVVIVPDVLGRQDLAEYQIPFDRLKTWDAYATDLPGAAANDDLAVILGTLGADAPQVKSADAGGTTVTAYARFEFAVPPEYIDGQTLTLRCEASMQVVSDDTATLDAVAYRQAAPATDICATAAQSINSATPANIDFTLTPTNVVSGDILSIRLCVAITDAGDAAANINAVIEQIKILADVSK